MGSRLFFAFGLTLMLMHEMDAIKSREWAIFPLVSRLDDRKGYYVFMIAHIPLYMLLLLGLGNGNGMNVTIRQGLDIFFVVHIFLRNAAKVTWGRSE